MCALIISRVLMRIVPPDDATGRSSEHAVMAGIVSGDAADNGSFDAALLPLPAPACPKL